MGSGASKNTVAPSVAPAAAYVKPQQDPASDEKDPSGTADAHLQEENADLQMENLIFSKTLDALKAEVLRLKTENEKLSSELKEKDKNLTDAVAESNRLAIQLRQISTSITERSVNGGDSAAAASGGDEYAAAERPGTAAANERADSLLAGHLFSYKLDPKDKHKLRDIHRRTNFEQVTVEKLFDVFGKHAVDGSLNRRQFLLAVDELGVVPSNQRFLFERLYTLFDRNGDQKVDFGEFAGGLSVLCSGSSDDKIKLMFTFVDADGNGYLTRDELTQFFMTLLVVTKGLKDGTMLDEMQIGGLESQCAAEVDQCFLQVDKDGDGKLTYAEFTQGLEGSQSQLQTLLEIFSACEIDPDGKEAAEDIGEDADAQECSQQ